MDVKLIEKSAPLVSRLTEDHDCGGVTCLKCLPALLIEDLTAAGIADNTAIQSLTAENATLLFKCREAEEGWKNALIAPLTWQAELTAERDALQQALADAQGAMTLTAEIGVTYFDQRNEALAERDAALARVAELKAGVGNIKKLATKRLFEGGPDGNLAAIEGFARALLEGPKQ